MVDTGIGIPEPHQAQIFDAFTQVDGSTTREHGGAGLGLTISSRLARLLGGEIWAQSEPGQGSRFHFTAAFELGGEPAEAASPAPDTPVEAPTRPLYVLVVEDNDVNRELAARQLETLGHRVDSVENGNDALTAAEKNAYDLILMDLQMPGMDGLEAIRRIRAREQESGGRTHIIVLTAHTMAADRERCTKAGADGFLAKPMYRRDLIAQIANVGEKN